MTDEQLTVLAHEFAEEMCSEMEDSFEKDEAININELHFNCAVGFLRERFYLADKSKVNEVYSTSQGDMLIFKKIYGLIPPIWDTSYVKAEEKVNLLESLFPDLGKEVENG